jgi:exosortase/archaeosortase family protein
MMAASITLVRSPLAAVTACRPVLVPPLGWLALQALALWPHGRWMAQRLRDGSDDPLGLAAIAVLAVLVLRLAPRLRVQPALPWLGASTGFTLAATAALAWLPPLVAALIAALAMACALAAWLPADAPRAPLAGLLVLALPLIASLQFYAGFPLRAVTAQLSAWGLQAVGIDAARSGASMTVNGQLVIVDAPCSGVQMAWLAYFCACTVAAIGDVRGGRFLTRLPWVGLLVLAGNVVRNTVLVALEARPQGLAPWAHEAIGIAALAAVCAAVVAVMKAPQRAARLPEIAR